MVNTPMYGQCTKKGTANDKQRKDAGNRMFASIEILVTAFSVLTDRREVNAEKGKGNIFLH